MKILVLILLLLMVPLLLHAHPGKTDRNGGHQCIKDCAEWDLYYREYHLHDKEGRPVKVARKKAMKAMSAAPDPSPAPQKPPDPQIAHSSVLPAASPEPDRELVPLDRALVLVLLLILLLLRRVRSRKEDRRS